MRNCLLVLLSISASSAAFADEELPRVLILGDSISIGYTPVVQELLAGKAIVVRPMRTEKKAENCAGTTNGVEQIDRWLRIGGGNWEVIHFNFGLHDMKRVDPDTGKPSSNIDDPRQADVDKYAKQLESIVAKLQDSNADLIFATTTPVPAGGVKPHRDVDDPAKYNAAAKRIMERGEVAVNDLYKFVEDRQSEIQIPVNVHFTQKGSRMLGRQVAEAIENALDGKPRQPGSE
ncbi:SGNH/GDSL hydrolase family protein [Stratiformator vulcanicus]|uniref:SGNH hydrolase-type esterase domain-containing protein n=1 Tax=Stratiformator vulcanicus TaxID=2527980 RepID=A0A517R228_9PLAN|nr:SGNH/GDSL hydrolase family protein [Stratiformator vulcanicus]QDT37930.1 hypothetical protein Pan189_23130 [Stratiformator vulcanicus]